MKKLTPRQQEILELYQQGKTVREISGIIGISERNIRSNGQRIKEAGYILRPENVSDKIGYVSRKVTSQRRYREDGSFIVEREWVREHPDQELVDEFHKTLAMQHEGRFNRIKPATKVKEYALKIPIGDPHFGMHSWAEETGEDYDIKIARDLHIEHIIRHIDSCCNPEKIFIFPLGDLLHMDSRSNKTEMSGHILDADTRYPKIIRAATELIIEIINYAASKTKEVIFSNAQGNHDWHSSLHVADSLHYAYKQSPHIKIDRSVQYFRYFEYFKNLMGISHGNTIKPEKLPALMAAKVPELWGRTIFRTWDIGHVHNQKFFEFPGCTVESHNPLAAKDSYAAEHGYMSRRKLTSIIMDREYGEVERKTSIVI